MGALGAKSLASVEATSKELKDTIREHKLWRNLCHSLIDGIPKSASGETLLEVDEGCEGREDLAYKHILRKAFTDIGSESLASSVGEATSIDWPEEALENVLQSGTCLGRDGQPRYWSSAASHTADSDDAFTLKLTEPVCIVHAFRLTALKAFFQPSQPVYAPKRFRARIGWAGEVNSEGFARSTKRKWSVTTRQMRFKPVKDPQAFVLPRPALCLGGFVRIELEGKRTALESTGSFYVAISNARVEGCSLPGFSLHPPQRPGVLVRFLTLAPVDIPHRPKPLLASLFNR